jgi:hypothetical protein
MQAPAFAGIKESPRPLCGPGLGLSEQLRAEIMREHQVAFHRYNNALRTLAEDVTHDCRHIASPEPSHGF